jgi:hypothetical protein
MAGVAARQADGAGVKVLVILEAQRDGDAEGARKIIEKARESVQTDARDP